MADKMELLTCKYIMQAERQAELLDHIMLMQGAEKQPRKSGCCWLF
jgi:hypothetical protein